jgi:hypothetical protein
MRPRWLAFFTALILGSAAALPAARAADSDPANPDAAFVRILQKALASNDVRWFAEHMRYPVRWFGPHNQRRMIANADWVRSHWTSLIGPALRQEVLAQNPDDLFKNYQGIMIGPGLRNIWANVAMGDEPDHLMIVTINDDE